MPSIETSVLCAGRGSDDHGAQHDVWVFYAVVLDVLSPKAKAAYQRHHRRPMARLEHGPVRLRHPGPADSPVEALNRAAEG